MKLWIIEENDHLKLQLESHLNRWPNIDCDLQVSQSMDIEVAITDKVIVDYSYYKELEQLAPYKKQLVVVTDRHMREANQQLLVMDYTIHFDGSTITSLFYKVFGIARLFNDNKMLQMASQQDEKCKVISVMSSTGGVGKTTFITDAAYEFSEKGLDVLIVDFSTLSSMDIALELPKRFNGFANIVTAIQGSEDLTSKELKKTIQDNIHSKQLGGNDLDIIYGISPIKMETIDPEEIGMIINASREMPYDVVLIDTSSELTAKNMTIAELSDHIVLMSTTDIFSGWKMIQFKEILDYMQLTHKCSLVYTKHMKNSGFSCRELEAELQTPLIGVLPFDKEVIYYGNTGKTLSDKRKHKHNKYMRGILNNIINIFHKKEIAYLKV